MRPVMQRPVEAVQQLHAAMVADAQAHNAAVQLESRLLEAEACPGQEEALWERWRPLTSRVI